MSLKFASVLAAIGIGGGHMLKLTASPSLWEPGAQTGNELTVLLSGERGAGTSFLVSLVRGVLRGHCDATEDCQMSIKTKNSTAENRTYDVIVSTWPGSRRMVSTAYMHTIPNMGHKNDFDLSSPDQLNTQLAFDRAVGKTLAEMPDTGRYIVVLRDPRDLVMSACAARHCERPDEFARKHIEAACSWTSIRHKHFRNIEGKRPGSVLTLFYEDMFVDPQTAADKIAEFMDVMDPNITESAEMHEAIAGIKNMNASHRTAPNICGFANELRPRTVRNITTTMLQGVPKALTKRWPCAQ